MATEKPKEFYTDSEWRKYKAPVVPPPWVVENLQETGMPVEWENSWHPDWPMKYLTEFHDGKVVTHLKSGSVQPVKEWLTKI
ncbi:MAG: hypothetical protein JWO43_364 [Candidatus Adlerbacteria bacterium]|nr:hypothetical protein [Candidatus Adlerbacteria bacterium]